MKKVTLVPLTEIAELFDNLREPISEIERSKRQALFPYYGATGQAGWIDSYKFDGKYILLGEDGAPFLEANKNKAFIVDGKFWVNNHAHVLKGKPQMCDDDYLCYALNWVDYSEAVTGSTRLKLPQSSMANLLIPLPDIEEQRKISHQLKTQLAEVEKARKAVELQLREVENLGNAIVFDSIRKGKTKIALIGDVLDEVKKGVGDNWHEHLVLGATRNGLALAKEPPGKNPQRYKPVVPGTIFYNPMRIMIGSIAMVDDGDIQGITSPDYVVLKGGEGKVDSRWFYYWLRSPLGKHCINTLARGILRRIQAPKS